MTTLSEHLWLHDYVEREEDANIATAKHTAEIGIPDLVYLGTFHGTCIKGCPGAVLVRDSGWTLGTHLTGYWVEHDETGERRYPPA